MDNRPIGIFDSGSGGLTTVRALEKLLPRERILYIGDTARMPYGGRSREEISRFSHEITGYLLRQDVKAVIAACGTISTNAPELRGELPVPCFDVVGAAARAAARDTHTGRVGLAATTATIRSGIFAAAIEECLGRPVTTAACPLLAPMVEHGISADDPALLDTIRGYCAAFFADKIDTLVLGCTHFPLIASAFAAVLGPEVTLIDSGAEAAAEAAEALRARSLLSDGKAPGAHFYFTGSARETARKAGAYLYGRDISDRTEELPLTILTGGTE